MTTGPLLQQRQLAGMSILLVEDNDQVRKLFTTLLTSRGAQVVGASTAGEAIEAFESHPPAVIVCDLKLPEEDGFSVIRRIRMLEADRGGSVPAIALSGAFARVSMEEVYEAGFQAFRWKPITPDELASAVLEISQQ